MFALIVPFLEYMKIKLDHKVVLLHGFIWLLIFKNNLFCWVSNCFIWKILDFDWYPWWILVWTAWKCSFLLPLVSACMNGLEMFSICSLLLWVPTYFIWTMHAPIEIVVFISSDWFTYVAFEGLMVLSSGSQLGLKYSSVCHRYSWSLKIIHDWLGCV